MPQSPYQNYNQGGMQSGGRPVRQAHPGNRYIPPTYNFGRGMYGADYNNMDWNNVQQYDLPQQGNNPYTQEYMGGLRGSTGRFPQGGRTQQQTSDWTYNRDGTIAQQSRGPQMPQFGGRQQRPMQLPEDYEYPGSGNFNIGGGYGGGYGEMGENWDGGGGPTMPRFGGGGYGVGFGGGYGGGRGGGNMQQFMQMMQQYMQGQGGRNGPNAGGGGWEGGANNDQERPNPMTRDNTMPVRDGNQEVKSPWEPEGGGDFFQNFLRNMGGGGGGWQGQATNAAVDPYAKRG